MDNNANASLPTLVEQEVKRWIAEQAALKALRKERHIPRPVIAISLALGSRGEEVAAGLADLTGFKIMDAELLDAIASDVGLQEKLLEPLDSGSRNDLDRWIGAAMENRLFLKSDYLRSLTRVVGAVAKYGRAVLVGRGAGLLLGGERAFHLRVVAPQDERIANVAEREDITVDQARQRIHEHDAGLRLFIDRSFNQRMDDPLLYDVVINTSSFTIADAVELALLAYGKKERRLTKGDR